MISIDEARQRVLAEARPRLGRIARLVDALSATLAEPIIADIDLPPFDKALMDGYAVRASDCATSPVRLVIGEEVPAGKTPTRPLGPAEAVSIMTGAPMPDGADAVVMVERSRREGDFVVLDEPDVRSGQNLLPRARELRRGETVLTPGTVLGPAQLGLLASLGRTEVRLFEAPQVTIIPTGDELVEPDQVPGPGQIRNSNAAVLRALCEQSWARVTVAPIAPDKPEPLRHSLERGLADDVLLITGGVSAGKHDLVPGTLEALGVQARFHKVRLKPGKPLLFGIGPGRSHDRPGTLVFGLPGNPVSGVVCFLLFVRPALARLNGRDAPESPLPRYPLAFPFSHRGDRPTYHPCRLVTQPEGLTKIEPLEWAGSADLRTVARADGFAAFPAGDADYPSDAPISYLPLNP